MIVRVAFDISRFRAALTKLEREELPFATALALTAVAREAQSRLTSELPTIFAAKGRPPTPFTMRAIGTTAARKSNLRSAVFVKRLQAQYLGIEETGGVRFGRPGAPILTPVDIATNQYGNIPRGLVRKLAANPEDYFIGKARGIYGLWERVYEPRSRHVLRTARGLRLLVAFHERAVYRPRFGFRRRVADAVNAKLLPALQSGMARAMATSVR